MEQIALDTLNIGNKVAFAAGLGDIFEHSPWIAETAFAARPFTSLNGLYDAMAAAVTNAGAEKQLALINAHPDLAGKAARAGNITVESRAEQASAGLDRLSDDEFANFHRLNDAYKAKFGIPFIVCVRRHTKSSILRLFEQRLKNDKDAERDTALTEIFRIAALRLDQRIAAPDRLKVTGRLSTHILDNHGGRPAQGVTVELHEIDDSGAAHLVVRGVTNSDGRTDKALIGERPVPIGRYEIRFAVGGYFARQGIPLAEPAFLDVVPVRFSVAEPEGHYHVPLLVTPWAYSTYRGS